MKTTKKELSPSVREEFLGMLRSRFDKHAERHQGVEWSKVQAKLESHPPQLWSLYQMESTGGEPDVLAMRDDKKAGEYLFVDCSKESPAGRRSVCYDREGWESRKEHRPKTSAMEMAEEMGVELLAEEEYLALQQLEEFDLKTSSWIKTPEEVRKLGGALYGERRYGRNFIGHNGAQSYYAARGFRAKLKV
jgi:hypothetical protein